MKCGIWTLLTDYSLRNREFGTADDCEVGHFQHAIKPFLIECLEHRVVLTGCERLRAVFP